MEWCLGETFVTVPLPPLLGAESGSWHSGSASECTSPPQPSEPQLFFAGGCRQELPSALGSLVTQVWPRQVTGLQAWAQQPSGLRCEPQFLLLLVWPWGTLF